jgi:hypothetical protein
MHVSKSRYRQNDGDGIANPVPLGSGLYAYRLVTIQREALKALSAIALSIDHPCGGIALLTCIHAGIQRVG